MLLDVALPQYSPWKPVTKTLWSFWRKEAIKGVWTWGGRIQVYRKMTAPKGRLTGAQESEADLIIVQVPAETSNSVNLQIPQAYWPSIMIDVICDLNDMQPKGIDSHCKLACATHTCVPHWYALECIWHGTS